MTYGLDLTQFSLDRFRQTLETGDLLPSRAILGEHLAERFAALEAAGIDTLQALIDALSTKKKLALFAAQTGLPEDYLTILRREARSYISSPIKFSDIPGLDPAHVATLAAHGITNTSHLFDRACTLGDRAALADQTGIPAEALLELVQLTDLARIRWAGPVAVRWIHDAGYTTLQALAETDPDEFYARLMAANAKHQLYKATLGRKDADLTLAMAQEVPLVVEY